MSLARADRRHRRWKDAEPRNVVGVARALTAVGPLTSGPRYWTAAHRLLGAAPHSRCTATAAHVALRRLSFIHFARWVLIDWSAGERDGEGERMRLRPEVPVFRI